MRGGIIIEKPLLDVGEMMRFLIVCPVQEAQVVNELPVLFIHLFRK
jgi:hypothetical protein